jgi:hypothetical protein
MTHPDVVRVYDDHPVIGLESESLNEGIDRPRLHGRLSSSRSFSISEFCIFVKTE